MDSPWDRTRSSRRTSHRELVHVGAPDHDRARALQTFDRGRAVRGAIAAQNPAGTREGTAPVREVVLEDYGQSVERAHGLASRLHSIQLNGASERSLVVDGDERSHSRLGLDDPQKTSFHHGLRRRRPFRDAPE